VSEAPAPGGHPLDPILRPRSVAVVGASADPKKRGFQVLRALRESGYAGVVHPVNPKGGEILGFRVSPALDDIPDAPDLALLCTPAATVPDAVEACGRKGVRGAVVLAVGFRESGDEGARLEERVLAAARAWGVRVVGPNTSGILNLPLGLNLIGARGVRAGSLSLLVQSGNMALALMNEVTARSHEGIAICVGVGNELDVGFHEYLDFLGCHEETRAVVCYVEGLGNARAFLHVAARVSRVKPVVVLKGGRSGPGREAARSHTGALAGEYDRLRAGLLQAGAVEIRRTDELLHVAETLATQPHAANGSAIAILSDGGGQGTLAADALAELGVPLAPLSADTRDALRRLLGRAAAVTNPVDLAGASDADPSVFGAATDLLAADAAVGAVLVVGLFGGYGIRFTEELTRAEERGAATMAATMARRGKPLVVHSMYASSRSAPLRVLGEARVPVVESLDVACRCIAEAWMRGRTLAGPAWTPDLDPEEVAPTAGRSLNARTGSDVLARARAEGRVTLTEPEASALLRDLGMPFPPAALCVTPAQAATAVEGMATAVAMKVVSVGIPHKSDIGGVALGVDSAREAERAFAEIVERATRHLLERGEEPRVDGVVVSPMLAAPLAELLLGARRDAGVGPVLTVGAGGIWTEALRDATHRVLPVGADEVRAMLGELRVSGMLTGMRGRPPADLDAVVAAALSVARCILDNDDVADVEVNPLFVYARGVQAVDARVFLTPAVGG
jgi:acetate---CoA ligase (ADP-forming)